MITSKTTKSNNLSSLYFLLKDHKEMLAWRPVVTGCNGNTLGLSNSVSEFLEATANSIINAAEVVSTEDLLADVTEANKKMTARIVEKCERGEEIDWEEEIVMFGSDVIALFPSLTSERTGEIVRREIAKSSMKVEGINHRLVCLYISLNRDKTGELGSLEGLMPWRRGKTGTKAGMKNKNLNSKDVEAVEKTLEWPARVATEGEQRELIARMGEI